MNCDTAFELLTDSEGSRSLALGRHLDDCPRCRAMQETLAPALEFLTPGLPGAGLPGDSGHESAAAFAASDSASRRRPLVTAEALAVARQGAAELTARTDAPAVRLQRAAVKSLPYAAVFAAGVLLAFSLIEARHGALPGGAKTCTRHEAARDDAQRTAAEMRALAASCATCHASPENQAEKPTSSLKLKRADDSEWLRQLLCDETLVAMTAPLPNRHVRTFG